MASAPGPNIGFRNTNKWAKNSILVCIQGAAVLHVMGDGILSQEQLTCLTGGQAHKRT